MKVKWHRRLDGRKKRAVEEALRRGETVVAFDDGTYVRLEGRLLILGSWGCGYAEDACVVGEAEWRR